MPLPQEFVQAWYSWRHASTPSISDKEKGNPIIGRIVYDLEHMASYLYSFGTQVIAQQNVDYTQLAPELSDLESIGSKVEDCQMLEEKKEEFRHYIKVLRHLLEEMAKLDAPEHRG